MALKSTVYKVQLQIADLDRELYRSPSLTLARHPSETDERLMMRLLAFSLNLPPDDDDGALEMAGGLSDTDEPDLWQRDLTGAIVHWIEVGLPDDRRLARACGRAGRVSVYAYAARTPIWWAGIAGKLTRLRNLAVWAIDPEASTRLAALARRSMQLQITVQDGDVSIGDDTEHLVITPQRLL